MGFVLKGKWAQYKRLLSAKQFDAELMPRVDAALGHVADIAVSVALPRDDLTPHAGMTAERRGGGPVLVETGALRRAVRARRIQQGEWWVGVPKSSPEHRKAKILEKGATIPVTDAMRGLFFTLWLVCQGRMSEDKLGAEAKEMLKRWRGWLPFKDETSVIRIPARPFLRYAFADERVRRAYKDETMKAVRSTFRALAK